MPLPKKKFVDAIANYSGKEEAQKVFMKILAQCNCSDQESYNKEDAMIICDTFIQMPEQYLQTMGRAISISVRFMKE